MALLTFRRPSKKPATGRPVISNRSPKTVTEVATQKSTDLKRKALADVALVKARLRQILSAFYEVGEALVRLKRPAAYTALGYTSFHELCRKEFRMSGAKADRLVTIVSKVSRNVAEQFGQTGSLALVALCEATPEEDTPAEVGWSKVKRPGGEVVDVGRVSANKVLRIAKEIRADRPAGGSGGKVRGRTALPAERARAAELERKLIAAGLPRATVTAVATRPGQPSDLRIEHIPVAEVDRLCKALYKS